MNFFSQLYLGKKKSGIAFLGSTRTFSLVCFSLFSSVSQAPGPVAKIV